MSHRQSNNRLGVRATLWLMALGAIVGATIYYSIPAHADPVDNYTVNNANRVCVVLDEFPSFTGIVGIAQAIINETGWGYREAGLVIGNSVAIACPWDQGLINNFVSTYAPSSASDTRVGFVA